MMRWFLLHIMIIMTASTVVQAYRLRFNDATGTKRAYIFDCYLNNYVTVQNKCTHYRDWLTLNIKEDITNVHNGQAEVTCRINGACSYFQSNLEFDGPRFDYTMNYARNALGRIGDMKISGISIDLLAGPDDVLTDILLNPVYALHFPDKDLNPGDRWNDDFDIVWGKQQKIHVTAYYTLLGSEIENDGKNYLKIKVEYLIALRGFATSITQDKISIDVTEDDIGLLSEKLLYNEQSGEIYAAKPWMQNKANMQAKDIGAVRCEITLDGPGRMEKTENGKFSPYPIW